MKVEDILKRQDIPEDECDICYLHEKAYDVLKENEILCPKCGNPIHKGSFFGYDEAVVSETNYYEEGQEIGRYPIYMCDKCDYIYALMPVKINYNGNHDIFYTGGSHFLSEDTSPLYKDLKDRLLPSIEQYTRRIKDGEKGLDSMNLLIWLQYDVSHAIAKFLYDNGYKK